MLVIAHRGASAVEPENTLRAFERSMQMGAQMIEMDLHLTRDGQVVVIHDDELIHTTSGRGRVSQLNFDEVRKADAGQGERVPTLKETLELTRGRVQLYLEIKAPQAAEETMRIVRSFNCQNEVMLASFNLELMRRLGEEVTDMEIGLILGTPSLHPTTRWREAMPWIALRHFKYQTLCMQVQMCSAVLARNIKQQGKKLYVWTANSDAQYARMIARGVDGICTDTPDRLIAFLNKSQSASA
ncbi:MAG TPA: glycerophosphodiester phosphodiesterase [Blastocatellia bacterium]|nr:glycerophosphodiester phosphodiesterase [Blastocatellia bacterium]